MGMIYVYSAATQEIDCSLTVILRCHHLWNVASINNAEFRGTPYAFWAKNHADRGEDVSVVNTKVSVVTDITPDNSLSETK